MSYLESVQLSDPGDYLVIWINNLIPYPERHVRNPALSGRRSCEQVVRRVQANTIIILYLLAVQLQW